MATCAADRSAGVSRSSSSARTRGWANRTAAPARVTRRACPASSTIASMSLSDRPSTAASSLGSHGSPSRAARLQDGPRAARRPAPAAGAGRPRCCAHAHPSRRRRAPPRSTGAAHPCVRARRAHRPRPARRPRSARSSAVSRSSRPESVTDRAARSRTARSAKPSGASGVRALSRDHDRQPLAGILVVEADQDVTEHDARGVAEILDVVDHDEQLVPARARRQGVDDGPGELARCASTDADLAHRRQQPADRGEGQRALVAPGPQHVGPGIAGGAGEPLEQRRLARARDAADDDHGQAALCRVAHEVTEQRTFGGSSDQPVRGGLGPGRAVHVGTITNAPYPRRRSTSGSARSTAARARLPSSPPPRRFGARPPDGPSARLGRSARSTVRRRKERLWSRPTCNEAAAARSWRPTGTRRTATAWSPATGAARSASSTSSPVAGGWSSCAR